MKTKKNLPDHIEEYFVQNEGSKEAIQSRELFEAKDENIDLKTDLTNDEIASINTLLFNNHLLEKAKLNPIFKNFIHRYMRLKVSKDRQSRQEFVNINKQGMKDEEMNDKLQKNLGSLLQPRK